jgi:hypothetical protein
VYHDLGCRGVAIVGEGGIEGLESDLEAVEVTALAAVGAFPSDFPLEPLGLLLLLLGAIHPFWLVVAVQAVDLESGAALAGWTGLIALLAPQTAGPAAPKTPDFCRHEMTVLVLFAMESTEFVFLGLGGCMKLLISDV